MKRIARILSIINKMDKGGLYKQSDLIEKMLIIKVASNMNFGDYDNEDWGDIDSYYADNYDAEDNIKKTSEEEREREANREILWELLSRDKKTLGDKEKIAYLISLLGGKPYEPDPETMRLQEILGDPNLYTSTHEDVF